jgi:ACT domain-containing protein
LQLSVDLGGKTIVEKTESNTLRISFVDKVFPKAKYIFVMRDGRDAIASMLKRRHQSLNLTFLLKKARYLPLSDIPIVSIRYFGNVLRRYVFKNNVVYQLGPVFKGMDDVRYNHTEEEVVAIQWSKCIGKAYDDVQKIEPSRVHYIKYEDLVNNSNTEINNLIKFLKIDISAKNKRILLEKISSSDIGKETSSSEMKQIKGISNISIGRWKSQFDGKALKTIMPIIENTVKRIGYLN